MSDILGIAGLLILGFIDLALAWKIARVHAEYNEQFSRLRLTEKSDEAIIAQLQNAQVEWRIKVAELQVENRQLVKEITELTDALNERIRAGEQEREMWRQIQQRAATSPAQVSITNVTSGADANIGGDVVGRDTRSE